MNTLDPDELWRQWLDLRTPSANYMAGMTAKYVLNLNPVAFAAMLEESKAGAA